MRINKDDDCWMVLCALRYCLSLHQEEMRAAHRRSDSEDEDADALCTLQKCVARAFSGVERCLRVIQSVWSQLSDDYHELMTRDVIVEWAAGRLCGDYEETWRTFAAWVWERAPGSRRRRIRAWLSRPARERLKLLRSTTAHAHV